MNVINERVIRSILDIEGYVTISSLAEMTGYSVSSIKHNLAWIKEELKEYGAELISTPKKGLLLTATDAQRQRLLEVLDEEAGTMTDSFECRKDYILETLFYYEQNYTVQLFSEELNVSRSMIQKDLVIIGKMLERFNIQLKKVRKQGIFLKGNEFNIRQAMVDSNNSQYRIWNKSTILELPDCFDRRLSCKAYTYQSGFYSDEAMIRMQGELLYIEKKLNIRFTDIEFGRILEYLLITGQRIERGKLIKEEVRDDLPDIEAAYYHYSKEVLRRLYPKYADALAMEVKFLAARLFVASTCDDGRVNDSRQYVKPVVAFLSAVGEVIGQERIHEDEPLIHELSVYFERIRIRECYQILDWTELHKDVRKQIPALYAVCMLVLHEQQDSLEFNLARDDIAWISVAIDNYINDVRNRIQAVLVHATNNQTASYQRRKIERRFPNLHISECIYWSDYEPAMADERIVISTVFLKAVSERIILVTKHLKKNDMVQIRNRLKHIEREQQVDPVSMFRESVSEDFILLDLNAQDRWEVLEKMGQVLVDKQLITEEVLPEVVDQEERCSTVIGKGIAIPHLFHNSIPKAIIIMAKLKYPVRWKRSEKVSFVILTLMNQNDRSVNQKLFKSLCLLIKSDVSVSGIINAADKQSIMKALRA